MISARSLQALSDNFEMSGYIKYLSVVSEYPGIEGTLYDQLVHGRLNTVWHPGGSVSGQMDIRMRAFHGDSVSKIPQYSEYIKDEYVFTNLDSTLWKGRKDTGYIQTDRLSLNYSKGNSEISVGRQRIAWGTSLVWNIIDIFNPKSVLDFDYEEKPGADSLRLQHYIGALSKVELSVRPGSGYKNSTAAGLYSTNLSGYDLFLILGARNNRWITGGAWAGSILDGGFRGEFLISQSPDRDASKDIYPKHVSGNTLFTSGKTSVSFVLSGDYTFENSFYIHSECLYNSNGKRNNAGILLKEAGDAGMLSPARWSLYQEFAFDISPLTRGTVYSIFNPDDHSHIIVPMLSRSLAANVDLLLIGFYPSGKPGTEFGVYGKSFNLRLKYSF